MSSDFFRFTLGGAQGTTVTKVEEFDDGVWKNESIDSNEVWTYDAGSQTVTKTETENGLNKVSTYTVAPLDQDPDPNDGFPAYVKTISISASSDASLKQYDFTIDANNNVTAVIEMLNGQIVESETLDDPNEVWTYDPSSDTVTKTETEDGYAETTTYARNVTADPNDTEYFVRVSETHQIGSLSSDINENSNDDDILYGDDSDDDFNSGNGDDYVESGDGDDNLKGGAGNDVLYAGSGDDTVDGGSGNDLLVGGNGAGDDIYKGGTGIDTVKYSSAIESIDVDLTSGKASGVDIGNDSLSGIENVIGGDGDDSINGSSAANNLYGGLGDDEVSGQNGNDSLYGDAGDDTLDGGNGNDNLYGGADNDALTGAAGNDKLYGDAGADTLDGGNGNDNLNGGADNDTLIGAAGNDSLYGDAGADTLDGGKGNDNLYGGADNDALTGAAGNDKVYGDAGDDSLYGDAGNDTMSGGDGMDTLFGGLGSDSLTGGNDEDHFVFNTSISNSSADKIKDFQDGVDKIYLEDAIFSQLTGDSDLSDNIVTGTKALDANDYLIYNSDDGKLFYDADGSGAGKQVAVAIIGANLTIDSTDFSVI